MEGIPEWVDPTETSAERAGRAPWQRRGNEIFGLTGVLLPGIALAAGVALIGRLWSEGLSAGLEESAISPILLAILIGLAIRNTIGLPEVYEAGLQLCLRRILRVGVALLGLRLSLFAVGSIGLMALPVVVACIVASLLLVTSIGRAFGLPRRLTTLIAVGTAICGNTAIVATGPVIRADDDEISYAVGTITVFGLLALLGYPYLSQLLFAGDPQLAGFFLGTAIHDTAQVAGAALLYAQQYDAPTALDVATVTKLVRNLFMLAVIPIMALAYRRSESGAAPGRRPALGQMVPTFVFGFIALALLRSIGDVGEAPFGGLLSDAQWSASIGMASSVSTWCLTMAMASVGLGTNLKRLRSLGLRPLGVGLAAALIVGAVSAGLIRLLAPWMARLAS
jgi:uncharacterized integral membrane protein (TIGR00698 family)